jgi:hypothetical protein
MGQKSHFMKCKATDASRFTAFFEKPFVCRVKRRIFMRIVRFWRFKKLVKDMLRLGTQRKAIAQKADNARWADKDKSVV